ncbi:uncharacterized protein LOC131656704 [Vicia villosa]|uniref:uncharacterized protein LOC131656704 n=1 Tax=Vicia villosa TaxID=3911 RepID=UPI00273CC822|nr:uncharacterized protein LOC131656704 [Vicia villosa]
MYVDPVSWIPPIENDNNITNDDDNIGKDGENSNESNNNGGCDEKNDVKQNDDGSIIITPSKEIACLSTASTRKKRTPKAIPKEFVDNWEVIEKPRNDGIKVDKSYRHKKKGFTCRSIIEVEKYEKNGKRPSRKRKTTEKVEKHEKDGTRPSHKRKTTEKGKEIINAEKEEGEEKASQNKMEEAEINRIRVEKFLAEAHYNLLHWFDS